MGKQKSLIELIDSLGNIGEINLILKSLETSPLEKWVLNACILNRSGVSTRIPVPDILVNLAIELHLVDVRKQKTKEIIYLSNLGKELLDLQFKWPDRFSEKQGRYLFSKVIVRTEIYHDIVAVVNILNTDASGNMWISSKDKRINSSEDRVLRLFQQLRIAELKDDNIFISKELGEWLVDTIAIGITIDENTLLKILQRRRENGLMAERFVVAYEKDRLSLCGREDLSELVERISKVNISAGYDISSFDGALSGTNHDRFIEVKGTVNDAVVFFISKNELSTAKKLQDKYWLYYVINVKNEVLRKVKTLKNPYKLFLDATKFEIEPILWRIRLLDDDGMFCEN